MSKSNRSKFHTKPTSSKPLFFHIKDREPKKGNLKSHRFQPQHMKIFILSALSCSNDEKNIISLSQLLEMLNQLGTTRVHKIQLISLAFIC